MPPVDNRISDAQQTASGQLLLTTVANRSQTVCEVRSSFMMRCWQLGKIKQDKEASMQLCALCTETHHPGFDIIAAHQPL
jgi:hypothetical protein